MQYTRKRLQYHLKTLYVWEMIFFFSQNLSKSNWGNKLNINKMTKK